jgi:hypothetical protein
MKTKIAGNIYVFMFLFNFIFSQEKKIIFCDSITKSSIENVLIFNGNFSFISNKNGEVFFEKDIEIILNISHLLYKNRSFNLNKVKDTLFLLPKDFNLNEVVLINKKPITKRIFQKQGLKKIQPKNWGQSPPIYWQLEVAMYFPNEIIKQKKLLKKVFVSTSNYDVHDLNNKSKVKQNEAMYSPFFINICMVDSTRLVPKEKLFETDFLIKRNKNSRFAELIITEDFYIPESGFFIVLQNLSEKDLLTFGYEARPGLTIVAAPKNNSYLPFVRNKAINENWRPDKNLIDRNYIYLIGIEVEVHD